MSVVGRIVDGRYIKVRLASAQTWNEWRPVTDYAGIRQCLDHMNWMITRVFGVEIRLLYQGPPCVALEIVGCRALLVIKEPSS